MELNIIQTIAAHALPVVFAITVHEASHGYAAKYFGDLTAQKLGRITLNPLKHIDPFGTIILPALLFFATQGKFLFGWAKPVPVNFANLKNPKKDMFWVAAAGPASNLVMAILWAMLLKYGMQAPQTAAPFLIEMSKAGIGINLVLMVLNLLPLPPLDGGRIAVSLLPMNLAIKLSKVEKYGFMILIALMFTGILNQIMSPMINGVAQLILRVFTY
jgi:Zn-dependent protease